MSALHQETLEAIASNAPAMEPRDGPTVGFQRPADPEYDDHANEVVEEAFREGVVRGWWEAAQLAAPVLGAPSPVTLEEQIATLLRQHGLSSLTITAMPRPDGSARFAAYAQADGLCELNATTRPTIAENVASAIDALNEARIVKADVPALAPMVEAA